MYRWSPGIINEKEELQMKNEKVKRMCFYFFISYSSFFIINF